MTGNTRFNNTNTSSYETYTLSGKYYPTYEVIVYSGSLLPHYSMRILTFVLWMENNWSNSNSVAVRLNFTGNSCGGGCGSGSSSSIPVCTTNDANSSNLNPSACSSSG
jgi:hypothetical protein